MLGCPIRISADQLVCANPRGFSQLVASFVASESLGIPHTPLVSLLYSSLFKGTGIHLALLYSYSNEFYLYRPPPLGGGRVSLVFLLFPNMSMNVPPAAPEGVGAHPYAPFGGPVGSGEYRSRTDDLLRARQAL